jgi:hypothetical protein
MALKGWQFGLLEPISELHQMTIKGVSSVASIWAFALTIACSVGIVILVLNEDWFQDWGTPFALCMLLGGIGTASFLFGLGAFLFGQPKRRASMITGGAALLLGVWVFLKMMGGSNLFQ